MSLTEQQLLSIAKTVTPIALDLYDKEDTAKTVLPLLAAISPRKGRNKKILLEWLTAFPELRKWIDEKTIQTAFRDDMELDIEPYEITYEFDRLDADFDEAIASATEIAKLFGPAFGRGKVWEAYKILRNNVPTYDGQDFFDTDHTHPNESTFSNVVVKARSADATPTPTEAKAELKAAMHRLQKNQIVKNVLVSSAAVQQGLVVITKHQNVWEAYYDLLTEEEINGTKNSMKGKFLLLHDMSPASATDYTVDFIQSLPGGPRPVVMGVHKEFAGMQFGTPDFKKRKVAFGGESQYAFGPGFPQTAVRRIQS